MIGRIAGKTGRRGHLIPYIAGDSVVHRLDPRTKLALLLGFSLLTLLTESPVVMLLLLGAVAAAAALSGLMRPWLHALRMLIPFMIVIIVLDLFFTSQASGTVWWSAQWWLLAPALTSGGTAFTIAMALRLFAIGGVSFLFVMTTSFDDFVGSLRAMHVPDTFSFSLGFALKSVEHLSRDASSILDAQRSRGLGIDRGLMRNTTGMLSIFIPLTVSVLRRSDEVADAMQCRGFGREERTTNITEYHFGRHDAAFFVALAALAAAVTLIS